MVFGFVVEKFNLFIKQLSFLTGSPIMPKIAFTSTPHPVLAENFGIGIVILGLIIALLAFIKYKSVEKQLEEEAYRPSILLNVMLILSVLAIGAFLVIYLINRA